MNVLLPIGLINLQSGSPQHFPAILSSLESPFKDGFRVEAGFLAEDRERSLFIKDAVAFRPRPENRIGKLVGGTAFPPNPGTYETERLLQEGSTLLIKNAHYRVRALNHTVLAIGRLFGPHVGCNLYFTPAGQKGFPSHSDPHDALIWQIEGSKRWTFDSKTFDISKGDALFIPRGAEHSALAGVEDSLHATFSINLSNLSDLIAMQSQDSFMNTRECYDLVEKLKLPNKKELTSILCNLRALQVSKSPILEDPVRNLRPFDTKICYSWSKGRFIQIIDETEGIQILCSSKSWWIENVPDSIGKDLISYSSFVPDEWSNKIPEMKVMIKQWYELGLLSPA